MSEAPARVAGDRAAVVARLEAQLRATSPAVRPHEHATVLFRLGLAYAELPAGDPEDNLRRALACYERAAAIFDPRFDPVEHARVLNMAGAAHLRLGTRRQAEQLFVESARLLDGRDRGDEQAGVFNNLGLVRAELGDIDGAVSACDSALALFDGSSAESRRGRAAALHTRGSARAAALDDDAKRAALEDFEASAATASADDAPYHHALARHSLGVCCTALASSRSPSADALLVRAVGAFSDSLRVFTLASFPYQHALARHNLGRALVELGGLDNVRRAVACFEDAVAVLDPRLHGPAWKHAFASLEKAEAALAALLGGPVDRAQSFANLLASVEETERIALLRERLGRYLQLPDPHRANALGELARAVADLDDDAMTQVVTSEIGVLMELPNDGLEAALRAMVDVHRQLGDAQERADRALDRAVSEAVVGPQRVWVRDFLYSIDWERP